MDWTLTDFTKAWASQPLQSTDNFSASGFSIDSRTLKAGEFFICLQGEKHDGHQYIREALAAGARGLLVEKTYLQSQPKLPPEITVFCQNNGIKALQDLAAYHRRRLKGTLIGITGSNGKTSTKEILSGLLQALVGQKNVYSTIGNFNNHIGLPLSLLRAQPQDRYMILEMGMNHAGEIALLSQLAQPHHALITCIAQAHCEFFTDVEAIARAKLEILTGMPSSLDAHLLYHALSPGLALAQSAAQKKGVQLHLFGMRLADGFVLRDGDPVAASEFFSGLRLADKKICWGDDLDLSREGLRFVWEGQSIHCRHLFQPALASNLLACLSLLRALGFAPEDLVQSAQGVRVLSPRRFERITKDRPNTEAQVLIDDSYNANPASFIAALKALRRILPEGQLALFMGEMGELGESALEGHQNVAISAATEGYSLLALREGEYTKVVTEAYLAGQSGGKVVTAKDPLELVEVLEASGDLASFDGILVKGSRAARMDLACDRLRQLSYV